MAWLEHHHTHTHTHTVVGLILNQHTHLGCISDATDRCFSHIHVSLSLPLPFSPKKIQQQHMKNQQTYPQVRIKKFFLIYTLCFYQFFHKAVTFTLLNKLGRYKSELEMCLKVQMKANLTCPGPRGKRRVGYYGCVLHTHTTLTQTHVCACTQPPEESKNSLRARVVTYSFIFCIDNVCNCSRNFPYTPPPKETGLFFCYVKYSYHVFS